MKQTQQKKQRVEKILTVFKKLYPDAKTELNFSNPLELLIATILAAQCTDERVNRVTQQLFKKYKTAKDYANCNLNQLEDDIKPTGFYKNKAKSIKACCKQLVEKFNGKIPDSLEELLKLPGIGRKTANLILSSAFGKDAIVVDTHLKRIAYRLGLTENTNPDKIEFDLMDVIPKGSWSFFSYSIQLHGRRICKAIRPACKDCKIERFCAKIGF